MPTVKLTLHPFDKMADATRTADDIKNQGSITYTDASGSTVNVTVGDVTVEGDVKLWQNKMLATFRVRGNT